MIKLIVSHVVTLKMIEIPHNNYVIFMPSILNRELITVKLFSFIIFFYASLYYIIVCIS